MSQIIATSALLFALLIAGLVALEVMIRRWERKVDDEIEAGRYSAKSATEVRADLTWDAVSKRAEDLTRTQQVTVIERIKLLAISDRSEGELITMALALIDKMKRGVQA